MTKTKSNLSIPIDDLLETSLNRYQQDNSFSTDKWKKIPLLKKLWNERQIKKILERLFQELEPYESEWKKNPSSSDIHKTKPILIRYLKEIDKKKLFFDQPFLLFFIDQGYLDVAEAFLLRAKKEDKRLENEQIYQALRNVWIMNSLQIYWDIPLKLTPPVFAYSMLYPYTDNLLDDPSVDPQIKSLFNDRLTKVLQGEHSLPMNETEERIYTLVHQIETYYPRADFPGVYESIHLIHDAQMESLKQTSGMDLSEEEVRSISFYKGGTSVLADGFLVKGHLEKEEILFSFQYGAFLQLLDDFQDIQEDRLESSQTLFSTQTDQEKMDEEVERLVAYIVAVNEKETDDTPNQSLMKEVIRSCTLMMIMDAVGRNPEVVSRRLYNELESYSRIRLTFYKELQEKLRAFFASFDEPL